MFEKQAEEKAIEAYGIGNKWSVCAYKNGYLASAEPREKQIQIDAEHIRALQKQSGELTDRVKELEAQIEKVKHYLDYDIPHDLINEATTKIWRMLK